MELVYLWVEKYKNIEKQGFNFSPRFECKFYDEYDEDGKLKDNCKLEIIEKNEDEYIKDFFGENINVTAIVGKNGSGKSSILEYIDLLLSHNQSFKYKFIFIYKINNILYNFPDNNIHKNCTFRDIDDIKYLNFFYDNERRTMENKLNLNNNSISKIICELSQLKVLPKLSTFMYFPIQINYSLINILEDFKESIQINLLKKVSIPHKQEETDLIEKIQNIDDEYHAFLIKNELLKNENFNYKMLLDKVSLSKKYISELYFNTYFKNIHEHCMINQLSKKEIFFLMKYRDFFNFDFIDEKGRRFSNLSHGEKALFGQLLNISYHIVKYPNRSNLFLFDEPELSLHPNWQKKYFQEIYNLLIKLNNKKIHIILTSHSPFFLSDIPKQNIIFLDTYKKEDEEVKNEKQRIGNCKVLTHEKVLEKKQTFGANIHTLLSDSFFMENGLMGEFAKNKIRTIKVAHRYILHRHKRKTLFTQSSKRCRRLLIKQLSKFWQIQEIIGEPFLQKIVKNQLEEMELILLGKNEAIDNEIARLQALKASLRC